jgi:TPP-dependent 2-oxoacid decarboxylase
METDFTVAQYLKTRLEQLGLKQMFGVAGNYTAPFLNTILADPHSPIAFSGNANEMCAGYAADTMPTARTTSSSCSPTASMRTRSRTRAGRR